MFRHRELGLIQSYQIGVTVLMTVLFWGYYLILEYAIPGMTLLGFRDYFWYYLAITLGFQLSFSTSKQHDIFSLSSGIVESHAFVWGHMVFATAITCMFLVLTRDEAISRLFLFTYLPLTYVVLVLVNRYFALDLLRKFLRYDRQKMLLIGEPGSLRKIESLLAKAKLFGLEATGILTDAAESDLPEGLRKLGGPGDLESVMGANGYACIFIIGSPRDRRVLGNWMRLAEAHGCRVSMVNDLDEFLQRRLSFFRCDDVDLIEIRDEPLQNFVNRILKRTFDVVVSLPVVLFVLPPLMLAVWVLQRVQAPGPLFFRQLRSGVDNRPFVIFKFRTLYADQCGSAEQVTAGDSRVFPAGRWLRKLSLDEFPQFFNVLLGQMSVVGPRPHMTEHDELFAEVMSAYPIRGFVKPGLTGLAQINGLRGQTSTAEDIIKRVERDLEYVENWSVALDVRIVYLTILQMIRPPRTAH